MEVIGKTLVSKVFPAAVVIHDWADLHDLNTGLLVAIQERRASNPGISTTNLGGWHSKKDLHEWNSPAVRRLVSMIEALVRLHAGHTFAGLDEGWTIDAWANVNETGDANALHNHLRNGNLLSGVYYVSEGRQAGKMDESPGRLRILDPHAFFPTGTAPSLPGFVVDPKPGRMLLFPSGLPHLVGPHDGREQRVSIAFNVRHAGFTNATHQIDARLASRKHPSADKGQAAGNST